MFGWFIIFAVVAIIAAFMGWGRVESASATIAKWIAILIVILAVLAALGFVSLPPLFHG